MMQDADLLLDLLQPASPSSMCSTVSSIVAEVGSDAGSAGDSHRYRTQTAVAAGAADRRVECRVTEGKPGYGGCGETPCVLQFEGLQDRLLVWRRRPVFVAKPARLAGEKSSLVTAVAHKPMATEQSQEPSFDASLAPSEAGFSKQWSCPSSAGLSATSAAALETSFTEQSTTATSRPDTSALSTSAAVLPRVREEDGAQGDAPCSPELAARTHVEVGVCHQAAVPAKYQAKEAAKRLAASRSHVSMQTLRVKSQGSWRLYGWEPVLQAADAGKEESGRKRQLEPFIGICRTASTLRAAPHIEELGFVRSPAAGELSNSKSTQPLDAQRSRFCVQLATRQSQVLLTKKDDGRHTVRKMLPPRAEDLLDTKFRFRQGGRCQHPPFGCTDLQALARYKVQETCFLASR
eukprot:TRINITY_DN24613_c0_g1_i1.p1 TRINITY_DN24613_c0_g1~~TRINITY_DN24613_c0_g1_i1.p1  ORF type:complete len:406 (-),score=68.04 TRINITY_DN24613_c0_g1_i1:80-1297(-)